MAAWWLFLTLVMYVLWAEAMDCTQGMLTPSSEAVDLAVLANKMKILNLPK